MKHLLHKDAQDAAMARFLAVNDYLDHGGLANTPIHDPEGDADSEVPVRGRGGPRMIESLREDMVSRTVRTHDEHRDGKVVVVHRHSQHFRHAAPRLALDQSWGEKDRHDYLAKLPDLPSPKLKAEAKRTDVPNSLLDGPRGVHERLADRRVTFTDSVRERSKVINDLVEDEAMPFGPYGRAFHALSDEDLRKHSNEDLGLLQGLADHEGHKALAGRLNRILYLGRVGTILGDSLDVDDPSAPANRTRLAELDVLSDQELQFIRDQGIKIHLVAQDLSGLRRRHPELRIYRRLSNQTRGFYCPNGPLRDHIFIFHRDEPPTGTDNLPASDQNAWASTVLHELGHALDAKGVFGSTWNPTTGIEPSDEAREIHARIQKWRREHPLTTYDFSTGQMTQVGTTEIPAVRDYFRGTPGGDTGAKEVVAEGYSWLRLRGWEECAEHFLDDGLANWLEECVTKKFPNAEISEHDR